MKEGDVVYLKSGGPLMTVKEIKGTKVVCQWFVKNTILEMNVFEESMLKINEEEEPSGFSIG